jgi:hypothetical protein
MELLTVLVTALIPIAAIVTVLVLLWRILQALESIKQAVHSIAAQLSDRPDAGTPLD